MISLTNCRDNELNRRNDFFWGWQFSLLAYFSFLFLFHSQAWLPPPSNVPTGKDSRTDLRDHFSLNRTSMEPPPPVKNFFVEMCNRPLKIIIMQFCTATALPLLELPDGCNGCRQGWGWGCRGKHSWGLGVGECWEGECGNFRPLIARLPDHSSLTLLKNDNFATAPQPPPL